MPEQTSMTIRLGTVYILGQQALKGRFLSESEIDISNCQIHMPNHYLKFEILKLSSITVECCISVSVLNLIHQESNHPIMFIFFGY